MPGPDGDAVRDCPGAADRWAGALAQWAIPRDIVEAAPESPWHFPTTVFARRAELALGEEAAAGASRRRALEVLPPGGSVLDVGVGGGAASLPLAPPAALLVGVDPSPDLLASFAAAAERRGVAHREIEGGWPDAADQVEPVDVVVCHHVLYNVGELAAFASALTDRARRRVVVEITWEHPTSNLAPLWLALHGIERPTTPTAEDAMAVLVEMGLDIGSEVHERRWEALTDSRAELVAMMRRRLCVGPERDPEIEALLTPEIETPTRRLVTIWWDGQA